MNIKLFTKAGLRENLEVVGLRARRWRSIHSVTNAIPSTLLDTQTPSTRLRRAFSVLAWLEERLPSLPGASIVVSGEKTVRHG